MMYAAAVERTTHLSPGKVERPPPDASGWMRASRRRVVAGCKKATRMREIGNTGEGRRVDDEASTNGLFGVRWTRGRSTRKCVAIAPLLAPCDSTSVKRNDNDAFPSQAFAVSFPLATRH